MSRIENVKRNIAFAYLGNLTTALLGFAVRKVFIMQLGDRLLGVNDYYTGILSVLSLAELGIGTALNFGLYKPVAENNIEKIKSYMALYRKAYRYIALAVAAIGLAIAPFVPAIIKNPGTHTVRDLTLYYLIFLFNTVTSYLVAYKYSLVNAEQKTYLQTNINTVTRLISVTAQIAVLLLTGNFYAYLLTEAAVLLLQKIFVSRYLNRRYPYLLEADAAPLSKEETGIIFAKTRALMWQRIGDIARLQTDSIIITTFVDALITGRVGHFQMIVNTIAGFVNAIFNAALPSFGNVIATETKERQYSLFKVYRFFAEWLYGYVSVGFYLLLIPLVTMVFGAERTLPQVIVGWIVAEFYYKGERIVLTNFKTAAGVFEEDKFLAVVQGAVNLVVSIVLVRIPAIGLTGVFIGTVVSGLLGNLVRPPIVYRVCFERGCGAYFLDSVKYRLSMLVALLPCIWLGHILLTSINPLTFVATGLMVTVIYHAVFFVFFGRGEEFAYMKRVLLKNFLSR